MEITLRSYRKEDFKTLENIIRKTWCYDDFSSPKIAQKLSRVFLCSCLTNHTFSRVAFDKSVPVGIILANNKSKHKCPIGIKLQFIRAIISLLFSKEGRKVSKIFEHVEDIDKQLLKECGKEYPAELTLFAIDTSYRGKGIGKTLFESALNYMKEQEIDTFYLFTDTSCNYGFYEHQGMIRRNTKEFAFDINGKKAKMIFFIYEYMNHII